MIWSIWRRCCTISESLKAQCRGKREGDPDMHYYGHPEKSMEIVRDIVIPELDRQGYVIPCFDVQELLYYVKYHDDHVSVKLKHVRRHTKMASFAMFQNLMLLQLADAKAHIQIPVIAERGRNLRTACRGGRQTSLSENSGWGVG